MNLTRSTLFLSAAALPLLGCTAAAQSIPTSANEARYAADPFRRLIESQWRARLEPLAFRVPPQENTERAGTSALNGGLSYRGLRITSCIFAESTRTPSRPCCCQGTVGRNSGTRPSAWARPTTRNPTTAGCWRCSLMRKGGPSGSRFSVPPPKHRPWTPGTSKSSPSRRFRFGSNRCEFTLTRIQRLQIFHRAHAHDQPTLA